MNFIFDMKKSLLKFVPKFRYTTHNKEHEVINKSETLCKVAITLQTTSTAAKSMSSS
jgi:hypothetical protein